MFSRKGVYNARDYYNDLQNAGTLSEIHISDAMVCLYGFKASARLKCVVMLRWDSYCLATVAELP